MTISFSTTILQFASQGEKTGWSYIKINKKIAQELKPDTKTSFRVKGKLDTFVIKGVALIPMGGGDFILAFNAAISASFINALVTAGTGSCQICGSLETSGPR